ncbi:MAG: membrane protein insertase YidC, partial [Alphaproteobacteria bacterium]
MFDRLSQNARLVIASLLSVSIIFGWQILFVEPMIKEQQEEMERVALTMPKDEQHIPQKLEERNQIISNEINKGTRVKFQNTKVKGSINLVGARIDDLILEKYSQSLEEQDKKVTLLSPGKALDAYFIELGWIAGDTSFKAPDKKALWNADKNELKSGETLTLSHNADGIIYKIAISLDDDYLFSVNQTVINKSGREIAVAPYALANRINNLLEQNNFVFHEGLIGVSNSTLKEVSYSDMQENKKMDLGDYSWVGFSDKYWLTSFISHKDAGYKVKATYSERDN